MGVFLKNIAVSDIVEGRVSGISHYGIFVQFENGYNGLIHISEISFNYVKNVNDYVSIGDILQCKVLEVDDKNKRLRLTIKELTGEIPPGFMSLKKQLPLWIEEKMLEISKKK